MRIVLCYPVNEGHLAQLQAAAPDAEIIDAGQARIDELLPTADIFIGHAKVPVDWDRVLAAKRLRWIQSSAAGLDHCLVPGVIDSDILVSSASGLFAPQVEPLASSSRLWDDPNVIITPHVGAQSARCVDDATDLACLNLRRYLAGELPYNRVDKRLGFPHPSVVWRPCAVSIGEQQ